MPICPNCHRRYPPGALCPVCREEAPYTDEELLEAYDQYMENEDYDMPTEEEIAESDGGSYRTVYAFLIAFGLFLLTLAAIHFLT